MDSSLSPGTIPIPGRRTQDNGGNEIILKLFPPPIVGIPIFGYCHLHFLCPKDPAILPKKDWNRNSDSKLDFIPASIIMSYPSWVVGWCYGFYCNYMKNIIIMIINYEADCLKVNRFMWNGTVVSISPGHTSRPLPGVSKLLFSSKIPLSWWME